MERIVIAAFRPFPGKEAELEILMETHWDILNNEGLVSPRKPIIAKAKDGSIIEVFGWKSKEAIQEAHENEAVQNMWSAYAKVSKYIPISKVEESKQMFSEFSPL